MKPSFETKNTGEAMAQRSTEYQLERRRRFYERIGMDRGFYGDLSNYCKHDAIQPCGEPPELICLNSFKDYPPNIRCGLHDIHFFPLLLDEKFAVDVDRKVNIRKIFEDDRIRFMEKIDALKRRLCP